MTKLYPILRRLNWRLEYGRNYLQRTSRSNIVLYILPPPSPLHPLQVMCIVLPGGQPQDIPFLSLPKHGTKAGLRANVEASLSIIYLFWKEQPDCTWNLSRPQAWKVLACGDGLIHLMINLNTSNSLTPIHVGPMTALANSIPSDLI